MDTALGEAIVVQLIVAKQPVVATGLPADVIASRFGPYVTAADSSDLSDEQKTAYVLRKGVRAVICCGEPGALPAAAARDLRALDAGAGARKAARENVMRGFIERESLEGTDPRVAAPGTLPTAARRAPLWDMGDLSNVDAAYDLEYVNPRQMRRAGGGTTKAKAENESDENDEYVNPRLSRLGSSARGSSSARSVA